MNVTGRTVSRWETGVNLPDLSLLVELADYYDADIREIIDGERKSGNKGSEKKEDLMKVSDYVEADKIRTVRKTKRRFGVFTVVMIFFVVICAFVLNFLFGNPVSRTMAMRNAQTILNIRFGSGKYQVSSADYWIEDSDYFVRCEMPGSPDSAFSMNFGMFGNYRYDDYENVVEHKGGVIKRMNREYSNIVRVALEKLYGENESIDGYGRILTENEESRDAAEDKPQLNYLSVDQIEPDQVFDFEEIGKKYGEVVIMREDTDLSAGRIASLLLELKSHLDQQGVRFQAISVSLSDRSSADGSGEGYPIASVWDFPCDMIYEDGLVKRVADAMQE